jgi:hypothetical protein
MLAEDLYGRQRLLHSAMMARSLNCWSVCSKCGLKLMNDDSSTDSIAANQADIVALILPVKIKDQH